MAKRGQKQPFSVAYNRKFFYPDAVFWHETEKAFRCSFSSDQRNELENIVDKYFAEVQLEQGAQPLRVGEKKLREIAETTSKLLNLLGSLEIEVAETYIRSVLDDEIVKLRGSDLGLTIVLRQLRDLEQGISNSLRIMQKEPPNAFRSGNAWSELIFELTEWAKAQGLPTSARNDGVAGETATPFTEFVYAMQNSDRFPEMFTTHMQSKGALGKAISRARNKTAKGQV